VSSESKVGLLFLSAIVFVIGFAYVLTGYNPFSQANELTLVYNFAGGIEKGSPVRVMGIKVGKVKEISFTPNFTMPDGEQVNLKVVVSIDPKAWPTLRQDSQFFINLAGVIGEKFIEVTPGSMDKPEFKVGAVVRGEDPPRIDQLISQSYGLAGKIIDLVEKNQGSVVDTIQMLNKLVGNLNSLLGQIDKISKRKDANQLLQNITTLTADLAYLTQKTRTEDGKKTLDLLHRLVFRLDALDEKSIRKFLQEEGIKARIL
jgi:phospholipid/cholesterol/gamma-HCH transport system substrate-binding protein